MADPRLSTETIPEEDLPRTLRREKAAQERLAHEQRQHEQRQSETISPSSPTPPALTDDRSPYAHDGLDDDFEARAATVTQLDIPFFHLMLFFLKAVIAAIPALILLGAILWLAGEVLIALFPDLVKLQILIRSPN